MKYDDYNIIPIGDHCAISIALKELGLRTKSYPFDWVTHKKELHDTNIITRVLYQPLANRFVSDGAEAIDNFIKDINGVFANWTPRKQVELVKI